MSRPPGTKLTPQIARDLCQRTGSKAYLTGSISNLGSQYVIGVDAVNCQTGDDLAREQVTADGKEQVLKALSDASTRLRARLGESLKTVQQLDAPIDQATTPSLEALQAYSLGRKTVLLRGDYTGALPLFERAISLDPNFAMAYASLGTAYHNLGEKNLAAQNTKKAYDLRAHVSEWERFYIESHYHQFVTGDLEEASQAYELWAMAYPRDQVARNNLGIVYQNLGEHEKALAKFKEAAEVAPPDALTYGNLALTYIHLNRFDEAAATAQQGISKNLDSPDLHLYLYQLAFIQGDSAGMARQLEWAAGKPGAGSTMLCFAADSAAYSGKLGKARELTTQAVAAALQAGEKEKAASCAAAAATWEAFLGNSAKAQQYASSALALSNGRDAEYPAALALAVAGDVARAANLTSDLAKRFPSDTVVQFNYLPTIQARLALGHGENAKAVELLQPASPYEMGVPGVSNFANNLYSIYVRGEALLATRQGGEAAAQFEKLIRSRGVAINDPIGALAHLGLARAQLLSEDPAGAKSSYQSFFNLWKDADGGIPVLKSAQAEYAKLH